MLCRHIKQNETYNLTVYSSDATEVTVEYFKIGTSTVFAEMPGTLTKINSELFNKAIVFDSLGEYIIKVTANGTVDYEKFKIFNFNDDDQNSVLNNMKLVIDDMNSEISENLAYIKKQVKIINARL